jgi:hypothetical protein
LDINYWDVAITESSPRKHWQDLKIFNLGKKIKEYQQNYFKHILKMPTY